MYIKKIVKKKCYVCSKEFTQYRTTQKVCSTKCAIKLTKNKSKKKKLIKEDQETIQDLVNRLQTVFNKFIRLRDKDKTCISCGKQLDVRFDAGHYYSAGGHWNVRFNEDNVHGQCSRPCNKDKHGDLINYRKGLMERIGEERIEILDELSSKDANFTRDQLRELIIFYKKKIKDIV